MLCTLQTHKLSNAAIRSVSTLGVISALCLAPLGFSQDRDRDRDRVTTLTRGTVIPVRTNEAIDVERSDNRVYTGITDQDVRGDDGRLAIPRGSRVELIVRVSHDNDLILDLDSVEVRGQRYAIR